MNRRSSLAPRVFAILAIVAAAAIGPAVGLAIARRPRSAVTIVSVPVAPPLPTPSEVITAATTKTIERPDHVDAVLDGPMNQSSLDSVLAQLKKARGKSMHLRITSPGGDGFAMLRFFRDVEDIKRDRKVRLVCWGDVIVASAAAITMEAICDDRYITNRTIMLFHGAHTMMFGNLKDIDEETHLLRALEAEITAVVAPRLQMAPEAYAAWTYGHDRFLDASEALDRHAVDAVVAPKDQPSAP